MSDLRDLNRAVQSAEFPSAEYAAAVREMLNEVAERMEPAQPEPKVELLDPSDWGPMSPETATKRRAEKRKPEPAAPVEMPPFYVIGHDGKKVAETTDGMAWAKEFCWRMREGLFSGPIDEGMMVGWFANAIGAGRSAGRDHSRTVGITPELETALKAAHAYKLSLRGNAQSDHYCGELNDAIAAVRSQYGKGRG